MNGDLLQEARERLTELEAEDEHGGDLGEHIDLDEGKAFVGRWRGLGEMRNRDGDAIDVYLLWDRNGGRCFHYRNTRLVWEIDELKPTVGDEIAIVRGDDLPPAKEGHSPTKRFAVRVRPCSDPLPGAAAVPAGDSDIPF